SVSMIAGEVVAPERPMRRIIVAGSLTIVFLYVGANIGYFYATPVAEMARHPVVPQWIMAQRLGPAGATLISVAILCSVFGALNGNILSRPRVPYAMARDGLAFPFLGLAHPRWSTPYTSILVQSLATVILIALLRDFDRLTTYFVVVEWFALLFAVAAVMVLRRRMPDSPRRTAVPPPPPSAPARTLVWSDEFTGPSGALVDATRWVAEIGGHGWGNNELEFYTDRGRNASLDGDGNLVIQALREHFEGGGVAREYTSARLKTQGRFEQAYGRFEARIQIPRGQGIWPAFWLLGADIDSAGWPRCGEFDVMETIGREPAVVHGSMHGPGFSGGASLSAGYTLAGGAA